MAETGLHRSLYGVVFVIAHETGKVLDSHVMSKECLGCWQWEGKEDSEEYLIWKSNHHGEINYSGQIKIMYFVDTQNL